MAYFTSHTHTHASNRKLRSSTSGTLLINLGISLLGIYAFFIVGGHIRPYGDTKTIDIICGVSSALLQYFMLVYFGWTVAEALNLYFSLVKVFEVKIIRRYTLKAGLIVWRKWNIKESIDYYIISSNFSQLFLLWLSSFQLQQATDITLMMFSKSFVHNRKNKHT